LYKIIRLLLPTHKYLAQFERESRPILFYFRQFGLSKWIKVVFTVG